MVCLLEVKMIDWDKYPEKDESVFDEFEWADNQNDDRVFERAREKKERRAETWEDVIDFYIRAR